MGNNIFTRAWNGQPLTPQERAFLKLVDGLFTTALIAAIGAATIYLSPAANAGSPFNWHNFGVAVGTAALIALVDGFKKYLSAKGDASGAAAVQALSQAAAAYAPKLPSFQPMQDTPVVVTTAPAASSVAIGSPSATANSAGDVSAVVSVQDAPAAS